MMLMSSENSEGTSLGFQNVGVWWLWRPEGRFFVALASFDGLCHSKLLS